MDGITAYTPQIMFQPEQEHPTINTSNQTKPNETAPKPLQQRRRRRRRRRRGGGDNDDSLLRRRLD